MIRVSATMTLRRHVPASAEAPTRREALVRPSPPPRSLSLREAPPPGVVDEIEEDDEDEDDEPEPEAYADEVEEGDVPIRRSASGLLRIGGSATGSQARAPAVAPLGSPFEAAPSWQDDEDDEPPAAKRRVPASVLILGGMVAVILVLKLATRSHEPASVPMLAVATLAPLEVPAKPALEVAPAPAPAAPEVAVAAAVSEAAAVPTRPALAAGPTPARLDASAFAAPAAPAAPAAKAKRPAADDPDREPTLGELIGGPTKPEPAGKPEPRRGPKSLRDVLDPGPAATPEPEAAPEPEPSEPQAVAEVVTRIISEPKAATVRVNGRVIGTTPTQVTWTTDRRPLVEVLLPDYAPVSMKLGQSDANKALYVALVRSAAVKVPAGADDGL